MKLYKFRPLGNPNDYCRVRRIITEGKFWCSKFWDLNDPMEGIFTTISSKEKIDNIFKIKGEYIICSFSNKQALQNPVLWGYYANGFKGTAIEIEIPDSLLAREEQPKIIKVDYNSERRFSNCIREDMEPEEIANSVLTRKLKCWSHEKEYRFLTKNTENEQRIGEGITKVIFGSPYKGISNANEILNHSDKLREYMKYKKELMKICQNKGIETSDFSI